MNKQFIIKIICIVVCILLVAACLVLSNRYREYSYNSLKDAIQDIDNGTLGVSSKKDVEICKVSAVKDGYYRVVLTQDVEIDSSLELKNIVFNLNEHRMDLISFTRCSFNNSVIMNGVISVTSPFKDADEEYITLCDSVVSNIKFVSGNTGKSLKYIKCENTNQLKEVDFEITGDLEDVLLVHNAPEGILTISDSTINSVVANNLQFYGIFSEGTLAVNNSKIAIETDSKESERKIYTCATYMRSGENIISDCEITSKTHGKYAASYPIFTTTATSKLEVKNSNIYGDSRYLLLGDSYGSSSVGIHTNSIETIVDNCKVRGVHCGMQLRGQGAHISNSSFESTGHGGIYFSRNTELDAAGFPYPTEYHVDNCTIAHAEPDGIFVEDVSAPDFAGDNQAAFYIGGSNLGRNITVYLNGCTIIGKKYAGVLRGTSGEINNTLYITNTTVDSPMRIDNNKMKFYVGSGCNITKDSDFYWNKQGLFKYKDATDAQVIFD